MTTTGIQADRPLLINVKQAARLLGVHRATVWRFIAEGKLETADIIQRRRLIRYASVERLAGKEITHNQ
jgi:excisionase family DNA binding protein